MPAFSEYKIVGAQWGKNILQAGSDNPYEYLKLYLEIQEVPKTQELPEIQKISDSKVFAVVLTKFINYPEPSPKVRYANDENFIYLQSFNQVYPEVFFDSKCMKDPQNQKLLEMPVRGIIQSALEQSLVNVLNSIDSTNAPHIDGKANIDKLVQLPKLISTEIHTDD